MLVAAALIVLSTNACESLVAAGGSSHERSHRAAGEPAEAGREGFSACTGALARDYACYQERYRGLVGAAGVEAVLAEIEGELQNNEFVKSNCHLFVHAIGLAAGERYGDVPSAFNKGDDLCAGGYYHGVVKAIVVKLGPDKMRAEANTVCADLGQHQGQQVYHDECFHALGHAFMAVLKNDLPEALRMCDALADTRGKRPCYIGVFMENAMTGVLEVLRIPGDLHHAGHSSSTEYLRPDEPLYPCTSVAARYKPACYIFQTTYAFNVLDQDFGKVFNLCATLDDDHFRSLCYMSMGRDANTLGEAESLTTAAATKYATMLCMMGPDLEAQSNCIRGSVRGLITNHRSDMQARVLCGFLDAHLRGPCLQETEDYYKHFKLT